MKQILLVDDSEIDRLILKTILLDEGYEVVEISNGAVALDLMERESLSAVFLDLSMPMLNGFDVLQAMYERHIEIPVFILTSEATKDNVIEAQKYHIAAFLRKPFQREALLETFRQRLGLAGKGSEEDARQAALVSPLCEALPQGGLEPAALHYFRAADLAKLILCRRPLPQEDPALWTEACALAERFDQLFTLCAAQSDQPFEPALRQLSGEAVAASRAFSLLQDSRDSITAYYSRAL